MCTGPFESLAVAAAVRLALAGFFGFATAPVVCLAEFARQNLTQNHDRLVHVGIGVVDVEREAHGAVLEAEPIHGGVGAEATGPDGDAGVSEGSHEYFVVDSLKRHKREGLERARPTTIRVLAVEGDARQIVQAITSVLAEFLDVVLNPVHPESFQVPDRGGQSDSAGDVLGAGLEHVGHGLVLEPAHRNPGDHLAAAFPGAHAAEHSGCHVQAADAGGAEHLVAAEGVEVDVEFFDVDLHVANSLGTIDEDRHTIAVGDRDDLLDVVHDAEHIGDVRDDEKDGTAVVSESHLHFVGVDLVTLSAETHHTDPYIIVVVVHDVEWDHAGVVVVVRDEDRSEAASAELGRDEGTGHHIDGLGGAGRPHERFRVAGADEVGDGRPGFLEHLGGAAGLHVGVAAAGVRVEAGHEPVDCLDDHRRLLARRSGIQPGGLGILGEEGEVRLGVAGAGGGSGDGAEAGVAGGIGVLVLSSGVHFRDSLSWCFGQFRLMANKHLEGKMFFGLRRDFFQMN